jgi:kynurenine formamidase
VLFHTATWNRYVGDKRYLTDFPGLGASAAEWIVQRGVKTFGVDSPTPDNPASKTYPIHMMCRREHITHYENLANLDRSSTPASPSSASRSRSAARTAGPTRAVALVE